MAESASSSAAPGRRAVPAAIPGRAAPSPAPPDRLRQVLTDLETVDATALADQPALYEQMHTALTQALDATAAGQGR